jgi:Domain of unknown function (DUF4498)
VREMLLSEDSEAHELFSQDEKSELLWRIFQHCSLGGPCCQYEVGLFLLVDLGILMSGRTLLSV